MNCISFKIEFMNYKSQENAIYMTTISLDIQTIAFSQYCL